MTALTLADYAAGKGKIVLNITTKDAENGKVADQTECPTALAWRRRFPDARVEVGTYSTRLYFESGEVYSIPHSPRLVDTIRDFDNNYGFHAGRYTLSDVRRAL